MQPAHLDPTAAPVTGVNLADLANQGIAETGTRVAGAKDLVTAVLADALRQRLAGHTAEAEAGGRQRTFQADQAAQDRAMQEQAAASEAALQSRNMSVREREAAADRDAEMREAQARADYAAAQERIEPFIQRRQTDEAMRRDAAQAALNFRYQRQLMRDEAALARSVGHGPVSNPLNAFGSAETNPLRGQSILERGAGDEQYARAIAAANNVDLTDIREMLDPNDLIGSANAIEEHFRELYSGDGFRRLGPEHADEVASIVLWNLGVRPAAG